MFSVLTSIKTSMETGLLFGLVHMNIRLWQWKCKLAYSRLLSTVADYSYQLRAEDYGECGLLNYSPIMQ